MKLAEPIPRLPRPARPPKLPMPNGVAPILAFAPLVLVLVLVPLGAAVLVSLAPLLVPPY